MNSTDAPTDLLEPLRAALRDGNPRAAERAVAPFIARQSTLLLAYADRLLTGAGRPVSMEGADLVQDAWLAALKRLRDDDAAIVSEAHLCSLLRRIIKTRFLDLIRGRRQSELELDAPATRCTDGPRTLSALSEWLVARERAEGDLLFGGDGVLLPLVSAVFAGDEALKAASGGASRRKARQYQALALFHLGLLLRDEVRGDAFGRRLWCRYATLIGVPEPWWERIDGAVATGACEDSALLELVNGLCETTVRDRAALSVLRYELNQLARPGRR